MARSETAKMLTAMGAMVIMWADFFAYYVLWLTMTYLTDVWKISFTFAAGIINVWSGASQMLPVVLAHIADAFVGNFTVLLVSTLSYCARSSRTATIVMSSEKEIEAEEEGALVSEKEQPSRLATFQRLSWHDGHYQCRCLFARWRRIKEEETMCPTFWYIKREGHMAKFVKTSRLPGEIGLGLLVMSTPPMLAHHYGTCSEYKPECVSSEQKQLFYIGLGLISVGAAGHLTSLGVFAGDQIDEEDRENGGLNIEPSSCNMQCWAVFLGIFAMVLVPIVGIIVIPYVKPWSVRYGIAAIFSAVSLGVVGTLMLGPEGALLLLLCESLFLRRPSCFVGGRRIQISCMRGIMIIMMNPCLILRPYVEQQETNRWRLCSVTEVEETKIFLRMIPMWVTFIACGLVSSVGNTYFLEQANHMNPKVGRLRVPLPVLLAIYDQTKSQSAKLYYALSGGGQRPSRYAPPIGIAASMVFAVLCCITAAKVESRRLGVVISHGLVDKPEERIPMSIFWLVPQFVLLGLLDGLYENSIGCFFNDQVGPTMRRYMWLFSSAVFGSGVMGSAVSVYVVGKVSERGGRLNWFRHTINESRLDRYYWVLAALSAANLVVYAVVACFYRYRESRSEDMEAPEYEETDGDRFEDNARCCCC
ncbi:hypothetical protein V2J09_006659 [Rumex salicifolius]